MKGPITVRRHLGGFKIGWLWSCTEHKRHRGFHHDSRRIDWYRKREGKPPDAHPWIRAVAGALDHWHRYHDPTPCACCNNRHRPERTAT